MTLVQAWTLTAPELWAMGYRRCEAEAPPMPMTILQTKTSNAMTFFYDHNPLTGGSN
jgi:hypothetical protein